MSRLFLTMAVVVAETLPDVGRHLNQVIHLEVSQCEDAFTVTGHSHRPFPV